MRQWLNGTVLLGVLTLTGACGASKAGSGPFITHDPGPTSAGDGGLSNPDDVVDPLAPVVMILEPSPAADPNGATVLTDDDVLVRCDVTPSHEPHAHDVDPSTIAVAVHWLDADGKETSQNVPVTSVSDIEYQGKVNLAMLPNGPVRFVCSAKDLSQTGQRTGTANVTTFLDLGPTVDILEPKEGAVYALSTVAVKFSVKAAPVSASDTEAEPTDVALTVGNMPFDTVETEPGIYTASVNYSDTTLFPMAPSNSQIAVTAKSSRTPSPGERSARVNIKVDSDGPSITFNTPADGSLVRGEVTLKITITDGSGVDPTSVVGTINRNLFELKDWTIVDKTYSQVFDTRSFPSDLNQLTINVHAADAVGNETNQDLGLRLDNLPPIVSLDPPKVRETKLVHGVKICSTAFDPLGDAIGDATASPEHSVLFRAMTWERTNMVLGDTFSYYAGVDSGSMSLYFQRPDQDFLIDTDGDGVCDEIETGQTNPDDRPVLKHLTQLSIRGSAYYPPMSSMDNDFGTPPLAIGCGYGTDPGSPVFDTLCPAAGGLTRVVNQNDVGRAPAIYAYDTPYLNSNTGECAGGKIDVSSFSFPAGWICVAARVQDNIGNVGVSPPLRMCIGLSSDPACSGPMPTCRAHGCTNPPSFSDYAYIQVPYI